MANEQASPPGLTPQDFHTVRAAVATEGVKGLFMLNGGGAVALLAFLQAVWGKSPGLAKVSLMGIGIFAFGALLAGFVNFLRYHASFNFQSGNKFGYKVFRFLSMFCQYVSLAAFAVGVGVLVNGAWKLLE